MTTQITKFQQQEKIRRLYFKHRGNITAIIEETGFDEKYILTVTSKIRKSFKRDITFEIACFVTDAILSGREQRLILLEDRLKEVLKKKELVSICCGAPVAKPTYEESTWYKCKKCGENCEIQEADLVNDNTVVKLIDRMRREDELVGKFLATMGIIANKPEEQPPSVQTAPPTQYVESRELPPVEKKLTEDMKKLTESQLSEIRRTTEAMIKDALDGSEES